jgi:hypothetical protein
MFRSGSDFESELGPSEPMLQLRSACRDSIRLTTATLIMATAAAAAATIANGFAGAAVAASAAAVARVAFEFKSSLSSCPSRLLHQGRSPPPASKSQVEGRSATCITCCITKPVTVMGRGHVSLLSILDTWRSKPFRHCQSSSQNTHRDHDSSDAGATTRMHTRRYPNNLDDE